MEGTVVVLAVGSSVPWVTALEPGFPADEPGRSLRCAVRSVPTIELALLDLDASDCPDLVVLAARDLPDRSGLSQLVDAAHPVPVVVVDDDADWSARAAAVSVGAVDVLHREALTDRALVGRVLGAVLERGRLRRELDAARAVALHERELRRLVAVQPGTATSAEMLEQGPLAVRAPGFWRRVVADYRRILRLAVEQLHFRVEGDPSGDLRSLADLLAWAHAGPGDVMRLHGEVVDGLAATVHGRERIELLGEVRVRVLELMGALAARYRTSSLNRPAAARTDKSDESSGVADESVEGSS